jgi:hypothetical protein
MTRGEKAGAQASRQLRLMHRIRTRASGRPKPDVRRSADSSLPMRVTYLSDFLPICMPHSASSCTHAQTYKRAEREGGMEGRMEG